MSSIPGTNVAAPIAPFDSGDKFATHLAKYGKGGHRTVDTLVERDSIPPDRRELLMTVAVIEDGKTYKLINDDQLINTTVDTDWMDVSTASFKDVLIMVNPVTVGPQVTEVLFPYKGTIKKLIAALPTGTILTKDFVVNTECWKGGAWQTVGTVTIRVGSTTGSTVVSPGFDIDIAALRVNIINCQENIPSMSNIITIY